MRIGAFAGVGDGLGLGDGEGGGGGDGPGVGGGGSPGAIACQLGACDVPASTQRPCLTVFINKTIDVPFPVVEAGSVVPGRASCLRPAANVSQSVRSVWTS